MKPTIYCKEKTKGMHSFYIIADTGLEYFLFSQSYRKDVQNYFVKGVRLEQARNFAKSNKNSAIMRTMQKLPMYIKYVEKEYDIEIFEQTRKKTCKTKCEMYNSYCVWGVILVKKILFCNIPMKANTEKCVYISEDLSVPVSNTPVIYPVNAFFEKNA